MTRRQWLTVPDELADLADRVLSYFEGYGYVVHPELREPGFPGTPTLVAKRNRGRTSVIVEVQYVLNADRLQEWARFAKACRTETKVVVCLPAESPRPERHEEALREAGVGILISSNTGVMELVAPRDLAIEVPLPERATMPTRLRRQLGPVYEKFDRGEWQDGFADACQVLETEASRYLIDGIRRGRVTFRTKAGNAKTYAAIDINRMPIGPLSNAFSEIEIQNYADVVILNSLQRINPDRVGRTHHAARAATQTRLRHNVPRHMWVLVEGLKAAHGIT